MKRLSKFLSAALLTGGLANPSPIWAQPADDSAADSAPQGDGAADPAPGDDAAADPAGDQPVAPTVQPMTPPETAPADAGPAGRTFTPAELAELAEIERNLAEYDRAANMHHRRVKDYLYGQYLDRKTRLEKRYAEAIDKASAEERKRHLEAIALLEKFIVDYPDHPQFTPDAMFRLADLYLDEANYAFEKAFDEAAEGELADLDMQRADYSKALDLWTVILERFPDYRQRAGTMYLLAYYLKETGEERKSLAVYRGLVCGNKFDPLAEPPAAPDRDQVRLSTAAEAKTTFVNPYADCVAITDEKELVEDAWVRGVGDIHFETPGELNEAIASYDKVAGDIHSRYYDEALYKLAWSYYRNDDFVKAITAFDRSVAYSDNLVSVGKDPLPLRPEALQYIAIAFTDPWSLDEQPDPVRSLDRAMDFYKDKWNQPHVRDVFDQLGDTFQVLEANDQAIAAWRVALDKWPLHPQNPVVHQKIVNAYEAKGDRDAADREAARLATAYSVGTEWYAANETDREAMEAQAKIRETMLRSAAENTHKAAQLARKDYLVNPTPEGKEKYVSLYRKAAELYHGFISEYPTSSDVYEFTYRLGETNFFAENYMAAIPYYKWVRDHRELSQTRFQKSAESVVQSYKAEVDRRIAAGQLREPPYPTIEALKAMPKPIQPMKMDPLYADLQAALDEYQQIVNDPSTAPNMGLLAGIISFRHLQLDEAAKRFEVTFDKFCGTPEAVRAKDGLLAIYEVQGKDELFRETNEKFITQKCGTEEDLQLARAQIRSKEFREAEDLFVSKRYPEAALAFYTYYKKAPPDDPNLPVALYNAAVAYDKSGKPKTAVALYKEFIDSTDPRFRDSEYYLAALYNTAASSYRAFDYDTAVDGYLNVVNIAAEPGRKVPPNFDLSLEELRLAALYNAAVIRELDRVFYDPQNAPATGAISLYRKYEAMEPDRRKSDRAAWSMARVWEQTGELDQLAKAYADWRRKYGRDPGNEDDYVYSYYNMAKLYEKKGNKRGMREAKKATKDAWAIVGQPKNSAASDMAAEFAFEEAEAQYNAKFTPFKINRAPRTKKEAERVLDQLDGLSQTTRQRFLDLSKYESGPWSLAALARVGDVFFFQALKIAEIPIPKEIEKLDMQYPDKGILAQYMEVLQGLVKPLEDQAKQQWLKVVQAGKDQGLSNKWTQLAQERLHDFIDQQQFPVQREPLIQGTQKP